jgi:hypothetical protein
MVLSLAAMSLFGCMDKVVSQKKAEAEEEIKRLNGIIFDLNSKVDVAKTELETCKADLGKLKTTPTPTSSPKPTPTPSKNSN